ncbi:hypothetical protein DF186_15815 [Enterococcus hirae]|nr:hypothetical protein DF186_15815 [Enterococcus hirae]
MKKVKVINVWCRCVVVNVLEVLKMKVLIRFNVFSMGLIWVVIVGVGGSMVLVFVLWKVMRVMWLSWM